MYVLALVYVADEFSLPLVNRYVTHKWNGIRGMSQLPTPHGRSLKTETIHPENASNVFRAICNGNKTEWSPIRSVIIRVMTKSDDRAAGVRFVNYEYDYRPNWTTRSLITN